ncbi:hypothetical protein CRYUN_Cryun24cG0002100 [Craigia yunnanensis]
MDHISDENHPNLIKPVNFQEGGAVMSCRKFRHNRRALSAINHNLVGAKAYPCVVNKRGLSERNENFENNQLDPEHNPITRNCAAQISISRRHCPEETKKLKPSTSSSNEFGDCIFIDVEENKASVDHPVPMFLEETETKLNEAYEMEEVEMEDIVEEAIVDIDGCDAKNPLAVVDYVEDLYAFYREIEERLMLSTLQFNMSFPTPYVFMRRFLKAAQSDKKLELLSFFLIELALVEYEMLKFQPSLLAAAAIYTAQSSLYGFKKWSRTCECQSSYSEDQLLECSRLMVGFHQKAAIVKLTGVHRKYCTSKFGYTAKCKPAKFLLETLTQL